MSLDFVALGLDHGHILGMMRNMVGAGARCLGFWTQGTPQTLLGVVKHFPGLPQFDTLDQALESGAALALIACVPGDRAELALRAMRAGLDVMVDTPGCVALDELAALRACVAETGRIWSVNFSDRSDSPCATLADELVAAGAIGRVVQTIGLGPHRLDRANRPDWFFQRARQGGILTDLGVAQVDQFLHYTGAEAAEITLAHVANHAHPDDPELQDFGEIGLRSDHASGYARVDWLSPAALPERGDGRLTLLGTEGSIELRKRVDVGTPGRDHLILVNGTRCERIDACAYALPYYTRLADDVRARTETAMTQAHCFTATELALRAQALAERT